MSSCGLALLLRAPFFLLIFTLLLYLLGKFMAAGIGRFFWNIFERGIIDRVPLVRNVYSGVKQVTDFMFNERDFEFTRVVAVEYPRKGIWSIGFVTSESFLEAPGGGQRAGAGRVHSFLAAAADRMHRQLPPQRVHRPEHDIRSGLSIHD